jgi:hypothetical protein
MKLKYRNIRLSRANMQRLEIINSIVGEYQQQGLVLTLRQLYYQLVTRDIIPNEQREYDRLGRLLKEGRMAGITDWAAIEDRLRVPQKPSSWDSPADIVDTAARQYRRNRMEGQRVAIEVWVEKDALSGVLRRVTNEFGIALQVNRGYGSVTAMHDCFGRIENALMAGASKFIILYLGDHDPSGVDMLRDIHDRLFEFWYGSKVDPDDQGQASAEYVLKNGHGSLGAYSAPNGQWVPYDRKDFARVFEIVPVALTRKQIEQYDPPPNPAKRTDSRAADYMRAHGTQSWEVDALRPEVLNQILRDAITERMDMEQFDRILDLEQGDRKRMREMIERMGE